ncbi:MAG TPA: alkene reductase [Chthoniobacterales bacterium]
MNLKSLFTPLRLGALELPHRIVMAPLTRMRAGAGGVPTAMNATYYGQRVAAAMIITEATCVSQQGVGYPNVPGIFSAEQIAGWKLVTNAVHARGGRIVQQIVHNGRMSHSAYMPDRSVPVAPTAIISAFGQAFTPDFQLVPFETPRALETDEIPGIVESFRQAALNSREAGFDAVEIHGANGYLLDQFLHDGSNKRTDGYGGSLENRARLLLEVVDSIVDAIGKDRLGVRLSPYGTFGDMVDSDPITLYKFVIGELGKRGLAYLHLIEARASGVSLAEDPTEKFAYNAEIFRSAFDGPMISAGGYTPESAAEAIEKGNADAVAFGRFYIANPDLYERIKGKSSLNKYDRPTFYGGGDHGYTDYPTLAESSVSVVPQTTPVATAIS